MVDQYGQGRNDVPVPGPLLAIITPLLSQDFYFFTSKIQKVFSEAYVFCNILIGILEKKSCGETFIATSWKELLTFFSKKNKLSFTTDSNHLW